MTDGSHWNKKILDSAGHRDLYIRSTYGINPKLEGSEQNEEEKLKNENLEKI